MTECPAHPGVEAIDTCTRCGRFFCTPERFELEGRAYCADCGARDDVDWLGHHYRKFEGKRSGLAWFMLLLGLGLVPVGVAIIVTPGTPWSDALIGLGVAIYGVVSIAFFSGRPAARTALAVGSVGTAAAFVIGGQDFWGLIPAFVMLGVTGAAWTDVRSTLFYRQPVPRLKLYGHFHREGSNPLAVLASRLSLLAIFVPGLCFITLGMGVVSVTRMNSKAVPPVGNLSAAVAAIVVSLFLSAMWIAVLWDAH